MGTYFVIALRNLALARRRSLLLAAALALVAMFLVLLMSLSQGLRDTMVHTATLLSSGHINIAGFYKAKPDDAFPIISGRERLRGIGAAAPGVVRVIDRGRGWAKLVSESGSLQTGLVGIDVAEEKDLFDNLQLAPQSDYKKGGEARVLGDVQRLREPNTALIFVGQAKRLGVDVGDSITVSVESFGGLANTGELTVVAVARDMGFMTHWNVFTPKAAINDLYRLNSDVTGAVMVYLEDIETAPQVMEHLRQTLSAQGYLLMEPEAQPFWAKFETVSAEDWTGQKIDLTTWQDETSYMKWMLSALDTIAFLLTAVLLGIIVVGIMNAMWIAVRERTQEIGTLRAIGMR
ncbi:MAG: ABC transporter permease, partial [Deltaproteobacteria bacterium]|nr:ABC transporter permease [Deltaproteobacteria bacterium]